ncbi:MAG: M20/M25/M40 family metallo-hydrolase [Clostridia bacterium]|nr:M20/M25/M40 family metallo-hydrolase [Clostridia bacterium]
MINRERLWNEFRVLNAFDSESFHERDITEYLVNKLKSLGLSVEIDDAGEKLRPNEKSAGNIYAFLKGNAEGEALLFSAHTDTVSPGNNKKAILHEDGKVTSDGTTVLGADDITGIVAILEMLTVIGEENIPHPDIEVVFFAAEEPYCRGSSVFDFSKIHAKYGYVLDLDGPVGKIANSAPTILQFSAEITGRSAHAGFEPEKGISAILVASEAVSALKLGRIDEFTTANVGLIHGGSGKNIVPETVVVEGEVRSSVNEKAVGTVKEIKQAFNLAAEKYGAYIKFTVEEMVSAYSVDENSPVIGKYKKALEKLGYGEPEIVSTFGGSDNNYLNKYGIEGIVIANAMNKVHTTQEYFYMDELEKSAKILTELVKVR